MKEYDILDLEFDKKYKHPALRWYERQHRAAMDDTLDRFDLPKPPKDWNETLE